jgi:hypothetical protein
MKAAKAHVPTALRERVARQAGYRCGYCLCSQELLGMPMSIEHVVPEAAGGSTVEGWGAVFGERHTGIGSKRLFNASAAFLRRI